MRARSIAVALSFLVLSCSSVAHACGWDSDTIWMDARYMRDVLAVLVGRFPHNPPLYYEMRLARVEKVMGAHPNDLDAYDDAGVACDRLGRADDAIAWMEKKKARLDAMPGSDANKSSHLYRYLSNEGTFYYHRWLAHGASRDAMDDVKQARDLLGAAIRVNPNAHFGREKYQVQAMEWILSPGNALLKLRVGEGGVPGRVIALVPSFIPLLRREQNEAQAHVDDLEKQIPDAARGLAGLIALGSSWENIDVFHNLALVLQMVNHSPAFSVVASMRAWELVDAGKHTLYAHPPADLKSAIGLPLDVFLFEEERPMNEIVQRLGPMTRAEYRKLKGKTFVEKQYHLLRAEADAWSQSRNDYLLEGLHHGRHPDTDPTFWSAWKEPALPNLVRAKADPKLDVLKDFDGERPIADAAKH